MYFDYTPQKSALDLSTGLGAFSDAITEVMRNKQRQREVDAKLALDKTQQDINSRKAKEDTLRFNRQIQNDQTQSRLGVIDRLNKGDVEGAKIAAQGVVNYDASGNPISHGSIEEGPKADIGPAPQAPVAPQAPQPLPPELLARRAAGTNTSEDEDANFYQSKGRPMPAQQGVDPMAPPEFTDDGKPPAPSLFRSFSPEVQSARYQDTSDALKEQQAKMDQAKFGEDTAQYNEDAAAFPGKKAAYAAEDKQAERDRPYTFKSSPADAGVTVTANGRDRTRQQQADEFVAAFDGAQLTPSEKETIRQNAALIANGGITPKDAMRAFRGEHTLGEKQTFAGGQGDQNRSLRWKIAQMSNAPGSPKDQYYRARALESYAGGNRQDQDSFERQVSDWETKVAGTAKDAQVWKRLDLSLANVGSNNSVAQQDAISGLASVFRGGNAATKDVRESIANHLGGLGAKGEGWMEQAATGQLGAEQQRIVVEAAQIASREFQAQMAQHFKSAQDRFGPGTRYDTPSMRGEVNHRIRADLLDHGFESPLIFEGAEAPTTLGSTSRPYQHPKAKKKDEKPSGPVPPEVGARRKANKASADDEAMSP